MDRYLFFLIGRYQEIHNPNLSSFMDVTSLPMSEKRGKIGSLHIPPTAQKFTWGSNTIKWSGNLFFWPILPFFNIEIDCLNNIWQYTFTLFNISRFSTVKYTAPMIKYLVENNGKWKNLGLLVWNKSVIGSLFFTVWYFNLI